LTQDFNNFYLFFFFLLGFT